MKLTLKEFQEKVLPTLRAAHKGGEALRKGIMAYVDGAEIVDENGEPVSIEMIHLGTATEHEPTENAIDDPADDEDDPADAPKSTSKPKSVSKRRALLLSSDQTIADGRRKAVRASGKANKSGSVEGDDDGDAIDIKSIRIPASVRRVSPASLLAFRGEHADKKAYAFGRWALACLGSQSSLEWCEERGIAPGQVGTKDLHRGTSDVLGGYLVPEQFERDIIDLREQYGVFPKLAKVIPMTSDRANRPRRSGGLTAYFVGQGESGTSSTKAWDNVGLTAKKLMVRTRMTSEIEEDAVISIGDDLANEAAYAISQKIDECGFNGDGTGATYGGIVGVRSTLTNLSGTIANIAGLVVAAGNTYDEITLANFNEVIGRLPLYAQQASRVAWVCSSAFWGTAMQRVALAAGGVQSIEIIDGIQVPKFLGYPVRLSQVMPATAANSQVCCLFGNFALGAMYGDRRGVTIGFSDSATIDGVSVFETDSIAVRATARFDINVHDVGNASATAASRVPGPIVGLITAAA